MPFTNSKILILDEKIKPGFNFIESDLVSSWLHVEYYIVALEVNMKLANHLILCLILIGGAGLGYLFIPQVQNLGWFGLVILACPLMHIWMMKDGNHKH